MRVVQMVSMLVASMVDQWVGLKAYLTDNTKAGS